MPPFGALTTYDKIDVPLLDFQIYGNPTSSLTVFFVAGWPDNHSVFRENLISQLEDRIGDNDGEQYRIVGISMPGFQHKRPEGSSFFTCGNYQPSKAIADLIVKTRSVNSADVPFWGFPLKDVVAMLQKTMYFTMTIGEMARGEAGLGVQKRPILVGHDWGSITSQELLLSHPFFFDRVVLIDVGNSSGLGRYPEDGSIVKRKLFYLFYQSFIMITSYLLPAALSQRLLAVFTTKGQRPAYKDVNSGKPVVANWKMAWMYVRVYLELIFGGGLKSLTHRFTPAVPLLFLYSSPIPHMRFHSTSFIKTLEARGKKDGMTKVVNVRGGHWFFARPGPKFDSERQHIIDFIREGNGPKVL